MTENEKMAMVPFYAVEHMSDRFMKIIKWLIIVNIILLVLFFASNVIWTYYFNQYDWETEEITVDGDESGNANYIGGDGGIFNGEGNSQTQEAYETQEITSETDGL